MATLSPKQQDIASQYKEVYENTASRFGVINAKVDRREKSMITRPSEDGRIPKQKIKYQGPSEVIDFNEAKTRREQKVNRRYQEELTYLNNNVANTNTAPAQKKKIHTSVLARARGITFGITTMTWLVPIYFFWQLPISIVGSVMLGLSLQVETSYLLSAVDTAARVVGSLFGYEYVDLTAIGMLAVVSAAGFGVLSACVAGFTALLWGLHPLSGNAAGTKTATFIAGVVGACIPFANMFPWIIFWVLVMMRNPK